MSDKVRTVYFVQGHGEKDPSRTERDGYSAIADTLKRVNGEGTVQETVDRGGLHLEARYNYEARETGSAWATSQLWLVGSKFWDLKGAKDLPRAISQKMTAALCCTTPWRVPMKVAPRSR